MEGGLGARESLQCVTLCCWDCRGRRGFPEGSEVSEGHPKYTFLFSVLIFFLLFYPCFTAGFLVTVLFRLPSLPAFCLGFSFSFFSTSKALALAFIRCREVLCTAALAEFCLAAASAS